MSVVVHSSPKINERRAFRLREFCEAYGVGRTVAFAEIKAGRLKAFKLNSATMISRDAADKWLLEREQSQEQL